MDGKLDPIILARLTALETLTEAQAITIAALQAAVAALDTKVGL